MIETTLRIAIVAIALAAGFSVVALVAALFAPPPRFRTGRFTRVRPTGRPSDLATPALRDRSSTVDDLLAALEAEAEQQKTGVPTRPAAATGSASLTDAGAEREAQDAPRVREDVTSGADGVAQHRVPGDDSDRDHDQPRKRRSPSPPGPTVPQDPTAPVGASRARARSQRARGRAPATRAGAGRERTQREASGPRAPCEVQWWRGRTLSQFCAVLHRPDGGEFVIARSPAFAFNAHKPPHEMPLIARSLQTLVDYLDQEGWPIAGRTADSCPVAVRTVDDTDVVGTIQ